MDFIPLTRREEILYKELMNTQIELSQKNIEVKRLKRELNKKVIYESINHPLTN